MTRDDVCFTLFAKQTDFYAYPLVTNLLQWQSQTQYSQNIGMRTADSK